mmetsp:Transcript_99520/g.223128  ORF Transcript_99520/g.223128 Transcript_99520/m.223128 type:complete len:241 (+) Transcript_99520:914-1636(+)
MQHLGFRRHWGCLHRDSGVHGAEPLRHSGHPARDGADGLVAGLARGRFAVWQRHAGHHSDSDARHRWKPVSDLHREGLFGLHEPAGGGRPWRCGALPQRHKRGRHRRDDGDHRGPLERGCRAGIIHADDPGAKRAVGHRRRAPADPGHAQGAGSDRKRAELAGRRGVRGRQVHVHVPRLLRGATRVGSERQARLPLPGCGEQRGHFRAQRLSQRDPDRLDDASLQGHAQRLGRRVSLHVL